MRLPTNEIGSRHSTHRDERIQPLALMVIGALAFSTFALQALMAPVLAAGFAGQSLPLVLAAPLMGAAGAAYWPILFRPRRLAPHLAKWAALSVPGALVGVKLVIEAFNHELVARAHASSPRLIENLLSADDGRFKVAIVLVLAVPFALTAAWFSQQIASTERQLRPLLLASELVGAALGLFFACWALDDSSWSFVVSGLILVALAATFFPQRWFSGEALLLVAAVVLVLPFSNWVEPRTDLHLVARDFDFSQSVRELQHGWTTYSKVQTLELADARGLKRRVIAIGDGTGHAEIKRYQPHEESGWPLTAALARPLAPRRVLVLFAGAGSELSAFANMEPRPETLVGVELNPRVIQQALRDPASDLRNLAQQPGVHVEIADVRTFLERDKNQYDLILFSWSGATVAYYSGAVVHTTQYSFTHESLAKAWAHLSPGGVLMVLGGSKVNILASLRTVIADSKERSTSTVLLAQKSASSWKRGWDDLVLLVKKGGWEGSALTSVRAVAAGLGLWPVLTPTEVAPDFQTASELLSDRPLAAVLAQIDHETGLSFHDVVDDRPFPYSTSAPVHLDQGQFWQSSLAQVFTLGPTASGLALAVAAFLMVVMGLGIQLSFEMVRGQIGFAGVLGVAALTGWIYMATEILNIYRHVLYLGNPTLALVLAVGLQLVAAALAAALHWRCRWLRRGEVVLVGALIGLVVWALGTWNEPSFSVELFQNSSWVRSMILISWRMVAAALLSLIFPWLLLRPTVRGSKTITLCLAPNLLVCALATLVMPVAIENFGITQMATVTVGVAALALTLLGVLVWQRGST